MNNTKFKIVVKNTETGDTLDVMFGNGKGDLLIVMEVLQKNAPNHMEYRLVTEDEFTDAIKWMKDMLKSLYTYGSMNITNKYIVKYMDTLGKESYENLYYSYTTHLLKNYDVVEDTYTDCEGVTYNSLVKK